MRRMMRYTALAAALLLAGTWTVTHGQTGSCPYLAGCPDTTFGSDGKVAISLSAQNVGRMATQMVTVGPGTSEERIIAINGNSGWTIARHLPTGALDPSFGVGGVTTKTFKKGTGALYSDVVVQPDNKFLVAGSVPTGKSAVSTFAVARYTADGQTDASFGSGGLVTVSFSSNQSMARGIALQPDGKVVAVGDSRLIDGLYYLTAVRLTTNGQLDTTFGTGGVFTYNHRSLTTTGSKAAIQAVQVAPGIWEQRIVLSSHVYCCYPLVGSALVIRLDQNGQLDGTFGSGGLTETSLARDTVFRDMVVDSSNRIVAGGYISYGDPAINDLLVARFHVDGTLDSSFGNGGTFSQRWWGGNSVLNSLALQPDGMILAVGTNPTAIWRFLADGLPDYNGFGSGGWVLVSAEGTTPFPFFNDLTVAHRPDGTNAFVVGGQSIERRGNRTYSYWTLWRFLY